ncbi:MAG: cryptochrome/photolyase family protein [Sphingorhabdus sp.]
MAKQLVLILGDQLTPTLSSLRDIDPADTIVLMSEVMAEASYVGHHKKKIAFLFSAMRHFAEELRNGGWQVDYVTLDDPDNSGTLSGEVLRAADRYGATALRVTEPGEWRVLEELQGLDTALDMAILPDDRFIASHAEFDAWAEGRKALRMEYFYREMRRKTGLLMDGNDPAGGQWNYDHDNRKAAEHDLLMPAPMAFEPDAITLKVLDLVEARFADNFGTLRPFWFGATRAQAEKALAHFLQHALPHFGDYQDAMLTGQHFLYHAVISPYLNCGLLDALAICKAAEAEYRAGRAPLNAVEGFIRQIIGWREYVRGIYWREGPDYMHRNTLGATRPLPWFYWSADTDMACVRACVEQTRDQAYAHHIQRLMVTGNFALLAGIDPYEVHIWYLAVYADAYEWVEAPNTVGMSQFADGGLLASKPYISSGAYIDRMSDYCRGCRYNVKLKAGEDACPFNYLYWDFIARHRDRLKSNPRMGQMVRSYDRFSDERQAEIATDSARFLASLS